MNYLICYCCRLVMGANGENMDKKWLRGIHALKHTTDALWQLVAHFANK